jgi:hypothetical protein
MIDGSQRVEFDDVEILGDTGHAVAVSRRLKGGTRATPALAVGDYYPPAGQRWATSARLWSMKAENTRSNNAVRVR